MGSHVCPGQRVYTEWRYTARNVGVGSVPDVLIVWLTVLVSGPCTHVRDGRNAGTIMPLAPDQILVNCPSKFGNYPRVIVIRPSPLPRYCYLTRCYGKRCLPPLSLCPRETPSSQLPLNFQAFRGTMLWWSNGTFVEHTLMYTQAKCFVLVSKRNGERMIV